MIPTMIVVGALVGRWWAVPIAGCLWALLIVTTSSPVGVWSLLGAAAFGVVNAAVGVSIHRIVATGVRSVRPNRANRHA